MTWRRVAAALTGAVLGLVLIPVTGSLSATATPPRPLAVAGTSAAFHALTPTRLADTRRSFGTTPAGRLAAGGHRLGPGHRPS